MRAYKGDQLPPLGTCLGALLMVMIEMSHKIEDVNIGLRLGCKKQRTPSQSNVSHQSFGRGAIWRFQLCVTSKLVRFSFAKTLFMLFHLGTFCFNALKHTCLVVPPNR